MKKIYSLLFLITVISVSANAQTGFRGAYFMDGYLYGHTMNPALMPNRSYFGIGIGRIDLQNQSNLGASTFLYPTSDGKTQTFLSDQILSETFLGKLRRNNLEDLSSRIDLLSIGSRTEDGRYYTFGISLRVDGKSALPYDLFRFLKDGSTDGNSYDLGQTGIRLRGFAQVDYGISYPLTDQIRVGGKVKALVGAGFAELWYDKLTGTFASDRWYLESSGRLVSSNIPFTMNRPASLGDILDSVDFERFSKRPGGFGAAIDLGASWQILPWLQLSASLLDLGFIYWKMDTRMASAASWEYKGFDDIDLSGDNSFQARLDEKTEELQNLLLFSPSNVGSSMGWMPVSAFFGVKAQPCTWFSAGLLGTGRLEGPYSWGEIRGVLNLEPTDWFGLSGSAAYGTFGPKLSSAMNLRLAILSLFVGAELSSPYFISNRPVSYFKNHGPFDEDAYLLPRDNMNLHVTVGLNLSFGKKKPKPVPDDQAQL